MKTYNVLFISLDKDLLDQNSRVFERHKNYGKYFIKQANSIRCVSHYENENLISKGLNSYFCPIGIEIKDFNIKRDYDFKNNILFIGRLVKQKNIYLLLIVFSRLFKEYNRLKLIIVGEGELKNELIHSCNNLNIEEHVEFLGR